MFCSISILLMFKSTLKTQAQIDAANAVTPLNRMGTKDEIAQIALYLAKYNAICAISSLVPIRLSGVTALAASICACVFKVLLNISRIEIEQNIVRFSKAQTVSLN